MPQDISKAAFDALYDASGLPLSSAQKATLFEAYPLLRAMLDRANAPLPREAEPAVTFRPGAK